MAELYYDLFHCAWGYLGALASPKGLRRLTLPQSSPDEVSRELLTGIPGARRSIGGFPGLSHKLGLYFQGAVVDLDETLDFGGASPFFYKVWKACRRIPFGETRSYSRLAAQVGVPGAARAVGQAMARNPLPILVPCHRVIGKDGSLGGYSGGLEIKRRLLEMERGSISGL